MGTDERRQHLSDVMKELWRNGTYRSKPRKPQTEEHRQAIADAIKKKWDDPSYRERVVNGINEATRREGPRAKASPETRAKLSSQMKRVWAERRNSSYSSELSFAQRRKSNGATSKPKRDATQEDGESTPD